MKRILLIFIFLLALVSLSAVSASDNATDIVSDDENALSEDVLETPVDDVDSDTLEQDDNIDVISENSTEVAEKTTSQITASDVTGYNTFTTTVKFKLTSDGKPLASRQVSILLNGVTYTRTTDADGQASLDVNLKTGSYTAQFTYLGDNMTSDATATSHVTVNNPTATQLKIGDKYINYRQGSKCLFYVKLLTKDGKPIKNQWVTFRVAGKTLSALTNKNGIAKVYLNLKKGTHKVKYSFKRTAPYLASSGSFKIKVRAKMAKGDGYWLWSAHMKKVNLKSLAKHGTKHIFLHVQSIALHGKSAVVSFIKKAHKYKMKVHLWMQICYSGGKWVRPINKDNTIKYSFLNKKIKQAKKYAKIKGVDGIHFDYMRFGGTAHLYKNPNRAMNYFAKKASIQIHKVKSNCIVSGALMPEPSMMTYYYGQDVSTMSKYMDAFLPMVYKGNYHQTTNWIKSVTKKFVSQSNGAQIWTGLQSYHSDNNAKKLTQKALLKDARAAKEGGAKGVVLFRIGISCNFNFNKV